MGSGYRTFTAGEVLTASNVQNYLQDQSVMVFGGSAARSSAIGTANFEEGMTSYLTDTDKLEVYNGTNWVGVAPTTTQGLTLINTTSFSGVASQNFTSIFSSSYTNYKILLTNLTGANQVIRGRFGTSGTPNSASSYFYGGFTMTTGGTSGAASGNSQTSIFLTYAASDPSSILIDIFQPNTAVRTEFNYFGYDGYNNRMHIGSGAFTNTTSFTDFQIFPDSSNISGTASIYGYNA
jgi:hypothetical protein